jgi:hypothetical protein
MMLALLAVMLGVVAFIIGRKEIKKMGRFKRRLCRKEAAKR